MSYIDLRSDTVTKPCAEMRKAMYEAEVGDDVFKEDPTVIALEEYCAGFFGKEAALFVSSGVMGNQMCLRLHANHGDEIICERSAHIFNYESGSPAALSGIQLYPVEGTEGIIPVQHIEEAIRPVSAYYMPRTKAVALENTHNRASGAVLPLHYISEVKNLTDRHGLRLHLDGARIWNASAATGIPVADYAKYFHTVSACFSKGLGAPVGSIILGEKPFIHEAFRLRKSWGGGMRQVGILAAAALFAVKNNFAKLSLDHEKTVMFSEIISAHPKITLSLPKPHTNIILFQVADMLPQEFILRMKEQGILFSQGTNTKVRAVMHLDVTAEQVKTAANSVLDVLE